MSVDCSIILQGSHGQISKTLQYGRKKFDPNLLQQIALNYSGRISISTQFRP